MIYYLSFLAVVLIGVENFFHVTFQISFSSFGKIKKFIVLKFDKVLDTVKIAWACN